MEFATRDFLDSADMFDESSADVTGHILEALSAYGYTVENSEHVRKMQINTSLKHSKNPVISLLTLELLLGQITLRWFECITHPMHGDFR